MRRALIFGEVLFDVFPDGQRILGGAPFNVAWNLKGLGADPLMISAVGDDPDGEEILQRMRRWEMDTSGMQVNTYPTGKVRVTMSDGEPEYDIVRDSAYDYIEAGNLPPLDDIALIYHGSLALRNGMSRDALEGVMKKTNAPVFIDINLRSPWWNGSDCIDMLKKAQYAKLNRNELRLLSDTSETDDVEELEEAAVRFIHSFAMDLLIVTLGADGAMVLTRTKTMFADPTAVRDFVDPVGAGDAFSAAFVNGLLSGLSLTETVRKANEFAACVCALRGATTDDRSFYKDSLQRAT